MRSRLWKQGQGQGDQEDQEGGCVMVQEGPSVAGLECGQNK